jgi:transaldolase
LPQYHYRDDLERLRGAGLDAEACYESLVIADIQAACALLQPVYIDSAGATGYVSLGVSPELAPDTAATVAAAHSLCQAVAHANVLIKVPGTLAGIGTFEQLTAAGLRVNVTLIFSLAQYQAYLRGAQAWLDGGGHPEQLRAVASTFLSRIDTAVDQRLGKWHSATEGGGRSHEGVLSMCGSERIDAPGSHTIEWQRTSEQYGLGGVSLSSSRRLNPVKDMRKRKCAM